MTTGHWPTLDRRMNTGRLYHDIADLIYDSPGYIGSVCRSRAIAVEIMDLIAQADRNPEGHDPAEGHGRNDESSVGASGADAPNPGQSQESWLNG